MADVFSQKDIDSLLKGAAPVAPAAAADVIPYNFLRPPRISKDRQALLNGIYTRVATSVQALLSSRLRIPTDVTLSSVEQATFAEFIFSLANPCAAYVYSLGEKLGGQGVIDMGTDLAYQLVDRLFGGMGEAQQIKRALTPLERNVVRGIADKIFDTLQEAWSDHLAFEVEFSGFESAPDALQIASREDNVLVANIEVKSGSFASLLTICLPLISLENFLQEKPTRLSHNMRGSSEERAQYRQLIEAALRAARLPMTVQFPPFLLKTEEIAGLQVGQVIHTGHPSDVPIELHVRGTRRFLGTLGQSRRCLGMRITQVLGDAQHEAAPRSSRGRMV